MSLDIFLALATFSLVTSITPGPNNLMLMASGVNFGFRRSIPHMLGIAAGCTVLMLSVGFGLGALLQAFPVLAEAMKVVSAAYLIYLAWKIAFSGAAAAGDGTASPLTFLQAAAFQWVNPKAWVMALVAMGAYAGEDASLVSVLLVTAVFIVVSLPSVSVWTGFGIALRRFLSDPKRLRAFNLVMALLLVATLWPLLA